MEQSHLYSQPVVKNKLSRKCKNKFLSYSLKKENFTDVKNSTLDSFVVISPTKSDDSASSTRFSTSVKEDKVETDQENKIISTTDVTDEHEKPVDFKSHSNGVNNVEKYNSNTGKARNKNVLETNSLNDSAEYFKEENKPDCPNTKTSFFAGVNKNQQVSEINPIKNETDNKYRGKCRTNNASKEIKRIQCPLCLKTVEKYVHHIKSCAAKKNLTTQQLMMALQLQKKQAAERLALGLPLIPEKLAGRRTVNRKGPADSNLDLALALSASMREAEENQALQEAEVLSEAGLVSEAVQKRSTLEGFGFASKRPPIGGIGRTKSGMVTTLLTRTKEDRQKIITEKVAVVLIGDDSSLSSVTDDFFSNEPIVLSKKLSKQLDKELRLWKKASVDEERSKYYVQELSEFVSPSKAEVGCNLRHLSQIAGRLNTPDKDDLLELQTPFPPNFTPVGNSDELTIQSPKLTPTEKFPSAVQIKSQDKNIFNSKNSSTISENSFNKGLNNSCKSKWSNDWKMILGKDIMSDLTILVKDDIKIPAHKLVIFVRCEQILNDIQINNLNNEIIVWNDCTQKSCFAFLEYLYCSTMNKILHLSASDLSGLKLLAKKYAVNDLLKYLESDNKAHSSANISVKRELFKKNENFHKKENGGCETSSSNKKNLTAKDDSSENDYLNKSCKSPDSIQGEIATISSSSGSFCNPGCSSEETKYSQNEKEDIDFLLSLLQNDNLVNSSPVHVKSSIESPVESQVKSVDCDIEFTTSSNKRKHSSTPTYDDGDKHNSNKKFCYDECEDTDYDLTQKWNDSVKDIMALSNDTDISENKEETIKEDPNLFITSSKKALQCSFEKNNSIQNEFNDAEVSDKLDFEILPDNQSIREISDSDKAYIDSVWDGYEDLNCNTDDVWQYDSPNTKSNDVAVAENQSLQKCNSESDTKDNSSDVEIVSGTKTPIKSFMDDMETMSPKYNILNKKSSESIKTLTFESYFKNKSLEQENNSDNNKLLQKVSKPDLESVSVNSPCKSFSVSSVEMISSESGTLNSTTEIQVLESHRYKISKAKIQKSDFIRVMTSDNLRECNKSGNNVFSQKSDSVIKEDNLDCSDSCTKYVTPTNKKLHEISPSPINDCDKIKVSGSTSPNEVRHLTKISGHQSSEFSSQRDSINYMKALLDNSFEISDSVFLSSEEQNKITNNTQITPDQKTKICELNRSPGLKATLPESKTSLHSESILSAGATVTSTPFSQIIVSDKVTPLPDYSSMKTPLLKKELKKFGLKQSLERNKAKRLLQYIYDQTHPFVPVNKLSQNKQEDLTATKTNKSPFKNSDNKSQCPSKSEVILLPESDNESDAASCSSVESVTSSNITTDDEDTGDCDNNTQTTTEKLIRISCEKVDEVMRGMFQSDPEFYTRVLLYEPIPLTEFVDKVKALGYKPRLDDVARYLTKECVVYKIPRRERKRRRRRRRLRSGSNKSGSDKISPVKSKRGCKKKQANNFQA